MPQPEREYAFFSDSKQTDPNRQVAENIYHILFSVCYFQ